MRKKKRIDLQALHDDVARLRGGKQKGSGIAEHDMAQNAETPEKPLHFSVIAGVPPQMPPGRHHVLDSGGVNRKQAVPAFRQHSRNAEPLLDAMQKGVARGIFSNESGLGSAPIAAAAAMTKEPARQGLVSMTGTFIDTIVICTMTGLSIVIAGTWLNPDLEGVEITMAAFQQALPFPAFVASFSLMLCLVFFAFTTILGWNYYGERCVEYLFNRKKAVVKGYRWLYILAVFIGPYMTVAVVWNIADIFNALMAFPNLIALLALSGVVVRESRDYFTRLKQSK